MSAVFDPSQVTVFLPVGGRATRALAVTEDAIPKHLIELGNGLSVLEVVCRQLQSVGFRRFVFCTGHHQEQITAFVRGEQWKQHKNTTYAISLESKPLGSEGAILAAIQDLGITGQAMFIAGDIMVPWNQLVSMNQHHAGRDATITAGLTSFVTERTTDVGKFIVNPDEQRIVRLYSRTAHAEVGAGETALTSAGLTVVTIEPYVKLCQRFVTAHGQPTGKPFSVRDDVLPWALATGEDGLYGYDLHGEVLDLGTPDNIMYGQENWSHYVGK